MKKFIIVAVIATAIFSCKKEDAKIIATGETQHIVVEFQKVLNDTTALGKVTFNFTDGARVQAVVKNTRAYLPIQLASHSKEISSIVVEWININSLEKSLCLIDEQLSVAADMKPVQINVTHAPSV